MGKIIVTQEQKEEAIQIAIRGGNPKKFLMECGAERPDLMWKKIKKMIKEVDPDTYGMIPKRIRTEVTVKKQRGLRVKTTEIPEIPEALREIGRETITEKMMKQEEPKICGEMEDMPADPEETKEPKRKPLVYDGLTVVTVRHPEFGVFHYDDKHDFFDWDTMDGDLVSMPVTSWRQLLAEIPHIMDVLGVN